MSCINCQPHEMRFDRYPYLVRFLTIVAIVHSVLLLVAFGSIFLVARSATAYNAGQDDYSVCNRSLIFDMAHNVLQVGSATEVAGLPCHFN